jgi:hypothetical protein
VGKRSRRRGSEPPEAPEVEYERDGHRLRLRTVLSAPTRREYAAIGGAREDAWQRRAEFLFERLFVAWAVEGVPVARSQLLARYRFASQDERRMIREVLREHTAEYFPELEAP